MDFSLSEEQQAIQATFRRFADREIRPQARDLDENPRFPKELFLQAGGLGFFGMRYPPPEGTGADIVTYVLAVEEIARGSLAVAAACTMQSLMGTYFVHQFAEGELRERLFLPALRGEKIGAICMTEPNAGSDLGAISTRAVERDGRWLVTGQKTWVTSAPVADFFTVFARTDGASAGEFTSPERAGGAGGHSVPPRKDAKELSIFLVERGAAGLAVGRSIEKMGVRASLTSEVSFIETPATCLLGERGKGMEYLRRILAEIRVMTAALAIGVGRAAYQDALTYSKERRQFGRPIAEFQAVQAHLAEMAVDLEAARRLTHWAAWRSDQKMQNETEANMAKLFASEAALRVCDRAARVFASYGFANDFPIQRYLRDVRFTLIGGGTSEILRGNIAKGLK
ncbi:MAG: acyl-CoA dehydrogenase family protein [Deltaproteobacteria bacterium]|nr:acyl-CoA dehydrogenase family protein [Deltaproteobacteria bacterium]